VRLLVLGPAVLETFRRAEQDRAATRAATFLPLAPDRAAPGQYSAVSTQGEQSESMRAREAALPRAHLWRVRVRAEVSVLEASAGHVQENLPNVTERSRHDVL
jgi:hypothetical protein